MRFLELKQDTSLISLKKTRYKFEKNKIQVWNVLNYSDMTWHHMVGTRRRRVWIRRLHTCRMHSESTVQNTAGLCVLSQCSNVVRAATNQSQTMIRTHSEYSSCADGLGRNAQETTVPRACREPDELCGGATFESDTKCVEHCV